MDAELLDGAVYRGRSGCATLGARLRQWRCPTSRIGLRSIPIYRVADGEYVGNVEGPNGDQWVREAQALAAQDEDQLS